MQLSEHTTSLHEIREFLGRHESAPPAWSDPATPLDALYLLLKERREDPLFWADLADLTRRLEDARLRGDLAVAGGLDAARVDRLLADLRESLPANGDGPPNVRAWIGSGVGLAAVAGFVLLGTSLGCPTTTALCPEAGDAGIADDEQTVFCALVDIIDTAEIDDGAKDDLLACLPGLGADERSDLLDEFENASEEELAELLTDLAASSDCDGGGDDDTTHTDDDDH
jgi:hypothetical protein